MSTISLSRRGLCPNQCVSIQLRRLSACPPSHDDSSSGQQGLLLGWGGNVRASNLPGQAPAVPRGRCRHTGHGEQSGHATDFMLMATKHTAQAIVRAMGFMVVQQRHLWLNFADLGDADRKVLLNAPITPFWTLWRGREVNH
ncbi:translation initiation factor IF-2-like protein [Labeo rohita]|uniref:Translation initiation factor IF-2-like protein n=1 Tax=Labeo rohita TaxID=84645 RepID=A0A498N3D3_LABRO|nr:translation initiation factor IF-2-like protein [Labeo rohita]